MSDLWKRWEGQVIDHKYQLRQFLGSTDHSTVFCAEFRAPELRNAAVKFLAADLPHSEQVLAGWKQAQDLSHPHLLAIYSVGRCRIEDMDLIYVASEYADENLSEILPHRALTSEEAREMLSVVVEALVYLHVKKLTHGHVKPSNIMAIGDRLKLTSDTIEPLSEARQMRRKRDVYDAPEIPAEAYTPAADVWSLGVTLVEALTQQPAFLPFNENAEPVIPPALREPFREIAGNSLRRDPAARWESLDIAAKLNPEAAEKLRAAIAAANAASPQATVPSNAAVLSPANAPVPVEAAAKSAATSAPAVAVASAAGTTAQPTPPSAPKPLQPVVSPLSVPLSKEPAVPLAKQAAGPSAKPPGPPVALPSIPEARSASRKTVILPNYVVPVLAAVLIVAALVALPKMLRRQTQSSANAPSATAPAPVTRQAPAASSAKTSNAAAPNEPSKTEPPPSTKSNNPSDSSQSAARTSPAASTPAPSIVRNSNPPPIASTRRASGSPDRGEVLDQIIPRPSTIALASIDGTVHVVVRVRVDPAGNVSQALLEKPGPSKYFAQKSLEAARGWVFLSPANNGRSQESEWLIRFDFTHSGANAYPQQVSP